MPIRVWRPDPDPILQSQRSEAAIRAGGGPRPARPAPPPRASPPVKPKPPAGSMSHSLLGVHTGGGAAAPRVFLVEDAGEAREALRLVIAAWLRREVAAGRCSAQDAAAAAADLAAEAAREASVP